MTKEEVESEDSDEEESGGSDEECDEYMTTMEMFLTTEYISGEDSDYSPDEESDDSMEDESDCDISLETVLVENILETKRAAIPCDVELWVPMGCDETELTDEDEMVTIDMLCEDVDSEEDTDYIIGESSIDSLESESDGEICMETITDENIIDGKRTSKPCDVEIWCPLEEEDETDCEEETTAEMLCKNVLDSSQDSDYIPDDMDEMTDDSLEYDSEVSEEETDMVYEDDILNFKRVPKASEVDIWIPKALDIEDTVQMLLVDYDSSQDSDYCPSEESEEDSDGEESSDGEITDEEISFISQNDILDSKRKRIHSEVDLWVPHIKMTMEDVHETVEEPQEIIGEIVDKIRSLRHVEKHPWLSETTAEEVVVNTVQVDCIVSADQLEDSCIEATEEATEEVE